MRETIDSIALKKMLLHASAALSNQTQMLNDLNVFPVPDGDTGTNMVLTFSAGANAIERSTPDTVGEGAQQFASALLRGARGNSGVILSLLYRGFAMGFKDCETVDAITFAIAMDYGVAAAYKAVMKPAEGTILTVSRYAAAAGTGKARETLCIEEVLAAAIEGGEVALADSVNVNPVLKKAGVVDAGGKGFLIILQGMLDSLQGKPMPMVTDFSTQESANFSDFSTDDITFAYCTEFICSRETQKNPDVMRKRLNDIGDSLVVVEDDEIIKVHVHTNEPNLALQEGLTYGQLLTVKIENMRQQHTEVIKTNVIAEPTQKYGFVTVCAGDGLRDLFRDLGANGIISGGQTMNPSTDDILNEINRTPAEIVYVFPNNKNIVMAAEQTIPLVTNKKVIVIPSKTVPQGMLAMMLMDPDGEEEQNTATMMEAITSITSAEITYAARDSDFDGNAITEGDFLGLLENQFFATEKTLEQVVEKLAQSEKFKSAEFITIYTGNDVSDEQNQAVKSVFETHCPDAEVNQLPGGQPVYYYIISAE